MNRFIFQRIKTLKQLRNAETIYFRVYFSFIYVVRATLCKYVINYLCNGKRIQRMRERFDRSTGQLVSLFYHLTSTCVDRFLQHLAQSILS